MAKPELVRSLRELSRELDPDAVRLARQLRHAERHVVAFLPASAGVATGDFVVQLGLALRLVSGQRAAVIDVNRSWPPYEPHGRQKHPPEPEPFFASRRLSEGLHMFAPHEAAPPGAREKLVELMVSRARERCTYVLIDVGDFDRIGEFLGALDLVDGVIVIGRASLTTERQLVSAYDAVPPSLRLGVVLVH